MSNFYYLTPEQISRIEPYFPLSHSVAHVDDRRAISGNYPYFETWPSMA